MKTSSLFPLKTLRALWCIAVDKLLLLPIMSFQVFYYRAYHVPEQPQVCLPADSPVRDWAWVTAEEARRRMPAAGFAAVRDSLLLG